MQTSEFTHTARLEAVHRLLAAAGLPTDDVTQEKLEHFFATGAPDSPDGIVGVELLGVHALLRSLAVSEARRGKGVGRALVAQAERFARENRAHDLYLLTTTAQEFFERLGYVVVDRDEAPVAIRATTEFSQLCPSSSILMLKVLKQR